MLLLVLSSGIFMFNEDESETKIVIILFDFELFLETWKCCFKYINIICFNIFIEICNMQIIKYICGHFYLISCSLES